MKKISLLEIVNGFLFGIFFSYFAHYRLLFMSSVFLHKYSHITFPILAIIFGFIFIFIFRFFIFKKLEEKLVKKDAKNVKIYFEKIIFIFIFLVDLLLIPLYLYSNKLFAISSKTLDKITGRAATSLNYYFLIIILFLGILVLNFFMIKKLKTKISDKKIFNYFINFNILFFIIMFIFSYLFYIGLNVIYGLIYFTLYGA